MEILTYLKKRKWEHIEKTPKSAPDMTSNSNSCPDFGSSSYADFQDTIPKYKLRPEKLLRIGFSILTRRKITRLIKKSSEPMMF